MSGVRDERWRMFGPKEDMEFSVTRLRQLVDDGVTPGPWTAEETGVRYEHGHIFYVSFSSDGPSDADAALIAYLGTHRDRIVAMLEAADALAEEAYERCTYCDRDEADCDLCKAVVAYKKAKGA